MKARFWGSDWFAGLVISIIVVLFSSSASSQSLERDAYDWGVHSTQKKSSESIANIGRWSEPQTDPESLYIRDLPNFVSNASFNDLPGDIDNLASILDRQSVNGASNEARDFYYDSEALDIKTVEPDIADELSSIINKALTRSIKDRYQTGIDIANE